MWKVGRSARRALATNKMRPFTLGCCFLLAIPMIAQQPEDPENDKRLGLWLDQTISAGLQENRSLELEFHQRLDEGAENLYEYFFQAGVAFRLRPWLTVLPSYRYQRYPGDPTIAFENRLILNVTMSTARGRWRPILRTLVEGGSPKAALLPLEYGFVRGWNTFCQFLWHARRSSS